MIAFPEMLAPCAVEAGIKVPPDLENYDATKFPHWHIYTILQLGTPMPCPTAHWDNAKVISKIPMNRIKKITFSEIDKLGFQSGMAIP